MKMTLLARVERLEALTDAGKPVFFRYREPSRRTDGSLTERTPEIFAGARRGNQRYTSSN